jgi:hypothetical protein
MTGRKLKLQEEEEKKNVQLRDEKEVCKEVGIRLIKFREYLRKDLETLAEETQTEQSVIEAIENGDDREIGPYLVALSKLYGMCINWAICAVPPLFSSKGPLLPEIYYRTSHNIPIESNKPNEDYIELCGLYLLLEYPPFKEALSKQWEEIKTTYAKEFEAYRESQNRTNIKKITIDSTGIHLT